jgi:peptidoglycan pentaglycine glycine transferase (the first glycine)
MMQPFTGKPQSWNELIASLPMPHLLQTWEWSQVKSKYGWKAMPFIWYGSSGSSQGPIGAAMVLKRTIGIGGFAAKLCILYIPKGPNLDWDDASLRLRVLEDLHAFAKQQGAIFVKIDPDVVLGKGQPGTEDAAENPSGYAVRSDLENHGWRFSKDQIQFRNTVLVDLIPGEEDLLSKMKQKTRYNIRLAERKGVSIRIGTTADLPLLYRMYAETSVRDNFLIRGEDYYQTVWNTFRSPHSPENPASTPFSEPLIAEVDSKPVGAVSMFYFATQAIYLFGMSRNEHREKMPNYLLQWEAMRRAKALGCTTYNLWGAPDEFNENDGLWNVFRFKEGLGGYVSRTLGAWDFAPNPLWYKLYTQTLPRIMDLMRMRGKAKTRQTLGA